MSLSVQFATMIAMAIMGVWIGASIDTYGRFAPRRKRWHIVRLTSDIVFWMVQALLVFYVLLHVNQGDVRIYIFLSLFCGYAAYQSLLRSFYNRLLDTLIRSGIVLSRFSRRLMNQLLIRPVKILLQLLYSLGKMISSLLIAVLMFAVTVVWKPIKWLIPESFLQQLKKYRTIFKKKAGFLKQVKNVNNKIKQWFRKKQE